MSYNPGVQDISGQLRAQGVMAKARGRADMVGGIGDGMLQGYEIYTANKQKNAALSGANEAMLKPFLSDPEFQKYAPEGIEKFLTKREKEGGLSLKDNIQLSGMLTAAAASRKMVTEQQMAQSDMAARAQEQQINAMKIAQAQKQQAAEAAAAAKFGGLAQVARGEGFNVLRPEVLAQKQRELQDPMTRDQLAVFQATGGQTMGPEALGQFTNQRMVAAAKEGPQPMRVVTVRKADAKGNPIEETYDANTGKLLGVGPVSQVKHVLSAEEEADKVEQVERAKSASARVEGYLTAGEAAGKSIADIDTGLTLLEEIDTGFGETALLKAKQMGQFMGLDIKDVAKTEQLQNILGKQVMEYVNLTKGAVSDKEMKLFDQYAASMSKSPEGNKLILNAAKRHAIRAREIAIMVNQMDREGKKAREITSAVNDFQNANPLFDELKKGDGQKAAAKTGAPIVDAAKPPAGWSVIK